MDFADVKTRVTELVIDISAELTALLGDYINQAIREAEDAHNFRHMEKILVTGTTAGNQALDNAVPSDWKEPRGEPQQINEDGTTKELTWLQSRSELIRNFPWSAVSTTQRGPPKAIFRKDDGTQDTFLAYPTPDNLSDYGDGDYVLWLPYWAYSPTISSGTTPVLDERRFGFYAIYHATVQGAIFNENDEKATLYSALAQRELTRAINRDRRLRAGGRKTLSRRSDVYGRALELRR